MKQNQPAGHSDTQLLSRFEESRDQRAFAELIRRYGPMVLATARRVLQRPEDVEEAFQSTMFALAKSAGRLRNKAAVAGWLHKTAHRCAAEIHRANARWERNTDQMAERLKLVGEEGERIDPLLGVANAELQKILDEELTSLSEHLRDVIVLCELQGLAQKQAAQRLGVSTSTVHDRLAKGRSLLHKRLIRRGATLTLASLIGSTALSEDLIAEVTAKATLYATGKSAATIGVSTIVIQTADKVISTMNRAKMIKLLMLATATLAFGGVLFEQLGNHNSATATTIFFDDFSDGSLTNELPLASNGTPVKWTTPIPLGSYDASSGDLVMSPTPDNDPDVNMGVDARDYILDDTSVRVQGKISAAGGHMGVTVRNQAGDDRRQYFAGLGFFPQSGGTVLFLGRADGRGTPVFLDDFTVLPFDIRQEDGVLQFDVIDDELSVWGWRAGETMPDQPQLTAIDDTYESGFIRIIGGVDDGRSSVTVFRSVQLADKHIPEPSSAVLAWLASVYLLPLTARVKA